MDGPSVTAQPPDARGWAGIVFVVRTRCPPTGVRGAGGLLARLERPVQASRPVPAGDFDLL
jgi:hypothetical protein